MGSGGCCGTYATPLPVFNSNEVIVQGNQWLYVKPSVLSTKGMLEKKYNHIWNGQYPCAIVSPHGNDNGLYIHTQKSANMCETGKTLQSNSRDTTIQTYTGFGNCKSKCDESVIKILYTPVDASQYTTIVQKKCSDPAVWQKPIPGPKNGNELRAIDLSVSYSQVISATSSLEKCIINNF
jgi:hypothetical protein